jgi:DNA-binding LacI/PurR family transcriptional regulator
LPTQEEIARAVGVSRMTVYRYLKGKNVTKNTRQKIERFLQRVEYRPNLTARSLVMRQTRLIGLLVPSVSYSYYPEVIGALQKEIRDRGYNLLLCVSEEDPVQEKTELNLLLSIPVDGIIISPTSFPESEQNCRMLEDEKPPFVMFDRYFPSVRASYVTTDSYRASEALVQHLIDLGHRRIAHVGGPPSNFFANGILRGYKSALRKNGLPLEERSIFTVSMDGSDCLPALRAILGLKPRPSAIQAVNDPVAVELFKEALGLGVRIPEDLTLVGFSDSRTSALLQVPLTTVREPTSLMATTAVELLIEQIEAKSKLRRVKRFPGELIIRRSSAAPSNPRKLASTG